MAIDWGSILGGLASAYGAYSSADAASDSRRDLTQAAQRMSTDLLPYNFYGPGGAYAGFGSAPQTGYLPNTFAPQPGQFPSNLSGAGADIIGRAFMPPAADAGMSSSPKMPPQEYFNPSTQPPEFQSVAERDAWYRANGPKRDTSANAPSFQPTNPNDPYYQRSDIAPLMTATNRDVLGGGKFGVRGWMNDHPVGMMAAMTALAAGGAAAGGAFAGAGAGAAGTGQLSFPAAGIGGGNAGTLAAGGGISGGAGISGTSGLAGLLGSGGLASQLIQNIPSLAGLFAGAGGGGGGGNGSAGAGGYGTGSNYVGGVPRDINVNLGDMEPARAGLVGLGNASLGRAQAMGGLPANIQQALRGVQGASGLPNAPNTMGLQNGIDSTLLQSMFDMNRGSAAPGLQQQAFNGAGQQIADASRGFGDVQASTLSNLRAQAKPFEDRAYDQLQNDQFSRGQMGSSGGALQTEAFARGLGQADLQRQLSANQEARNTQQNALGLGQGLAGIGGNVAGLDDSLLQSAFGRFQQTAGLSSDLTQQRFGNSMLLNGQRYDRSQNNLQNQINAAGLPMALQGQQLQLALQSLGGANSLNDQGLKNFQASLAASQAAANARIGSGSNASALLSQAAQMPTGGDMWGQFLTGAGSRMMDGKSFSDVLGGLFGGNKTTQPVPQSPYTYNGGWN